MGTTHADYFHGPVPCTRELTDEEIQGSYVVNTGKAILEDLSSVNGTFLGLREPYLLVPGDVIRVGSQVFRFD